MTFQIDDKILEKYKLSQAQFSLLVASSYKYSEEEISYLCKSGFLGKTIKPEDNIKQYFLAPKGLELINAIIAESIPMSSREEDVIQSLAQQMAELFPKGRKGDTNKYWRGNSNIVKQKLKVFFKKYGKYSQEEILKATKKYIDSFNGNYTLMRILPYFIEKNNESELLTTLENIDEVTPNTSTEWIHTIV